MNTSVRKLTEGAMMIAIIGVLLFINRQFAGVLSAYFVIILPLPLVIYGVRYTLRDLAVVSVSLFLLIVILNSGIGDFAYGALAILVALVYVRGFKLKKSKTEILISTMIVAAIGEVLILVLLAGVVGISIEEEIVTITAMLEETMGTNQLFELYGTGLSDLMLILLIISTILMGALEAVFVHFVSNIILKRLKFEYMEPIKLYELKISKYLAYPMFLVTMGYRYLLLLSDLQIYRNMITAAVAISGLILFVFGYIAVVVYFMMRYKRNVTFWLILFILFLSTLAIPLLVCVGFIYNATNIRERIIGGFKNESEV